MASPRRPECGVFANANINQPYLIAWLDAQEQKPFLRVAPIDETVEASNPLHRGVVMTILLYPHKSKNSMIVVNGAYKEETEG